MSQSERDDYDDDRFRSKKVRSLKILKRAGMMWVVTWAWFMLGVIAIVVAYLADNRRPNPNDLLLPLFGHLVGAAVFLSAAFYARKGYPFLLWVLGFGFALAGMVYGLGGFLIGLIFFNGILTRPTPSEQVIGMLWMVFSSGFTLLGLGSFVMSLIYAIKKVAPPSNQSYLISPIN